MNEWIEKRKLLEIEKHKQRRERIVIALLQAKVSHDGELLGLNSQSDNIRRAINFADEIIERLDKGEK